MSKPTPCSIGDCEKPSVCRGWCWMHYARWQRRGTTELRVPKPCSVDGCDVVAKSRGMCGKHAERVRKHGDPNTVLVVLDDPVARFWSKVDRSVPNGCWLWTGTITTRHGYGQLSVGGRKFGAHRYAYELLVGPIPEGLILDHVRARGCRNRHCVNPAHLEPVTVAENNRRIGASRDV